MTKLIEDRISTLEKRNHRVELDKAWEVSWARKVSILALTYVVVVCYLYFVVGIDPWINALVPVMGYFLSTLSLSFLKAQWVKRQQDKS